jgi:PAS domain S-box-containing protein
VTRRAWFVYLWAASAVTAVYLAFHELSFAPQLFNLIGLSGAVAIVIGVRIHRPAQARSWYLIATGLLLFVCGDVLAYNYPSFFGTELPFPSVADLFYLAVYPFLAVGLFGLVRARASGRDRAALLDSAILTIAAAMVSWVFLIAPYARDGSLTLPLRLTSMAYPVMDLALVAMVVRLLVGGGWRGRAHGLLSAGVVSLLVTDAIYGWLLLNTDFQPGGPLDLGWALFYMTLGAAALHHSVAGRDISVPASPEWPRRRLAVLAGASLVAPALLIVQGTSGGGADVTVLAAGSAVTFLLVLLRMRRLMVDLRAHRAIESALREAEEKYRTLVEGLPAVVYAAELGPDGRWLYVSPHIETVLGYSAETWLSDPFMWERNVRQEDLAAVMETINRCSSTGERFLSEYRFRVGDGRERWIRDEASVVQPEGSGPPVIRGVMYDVTDQKTAEERLREALEREQAATQHLRELDDMKNSILNAVSHELRTPLTSILGMSRMLHEQRDEMGSVDADHFIERIGVNAERLAKLLSDLLDLDRLSRGILEPNRQPIDLPQTVSRMLAEIPLDGRRVDVDIEPLVAEVDAAQFERIVVNLVSNAVRYTPKGSSIALSVRRDTSGIAIRVDDSGPGISDELKESIFEPFRQGQEVIAHSPGVGIGLSLVAKFAALHGGRAWVQDRPGGGASFRVTLPSERVTPILLATTA